jgi:ribosomal protein S18 acetylase RimI-like enzyme
MNLRIEPWTGDLERAASVLARGFSDYPVAQRESPEDVLRQVADDYISALPGRSWIAFSGEEAVGGIFSSLRPDGLARIQSLAVSPESRRAGVGRALLARCVEGLEGAGASAIHLEVIKSNEAAIALYRLFGFETVRELVCLKGKPPVGAKTAQLAPGPPLSYSGVDAPLHRDFLALASLPDVRFAWSGRGAAWVAWRGGVLLAAEDWWSVGELSGLLAAIPTETLKMIDVPAEAPLVGVLVSLGFEEYARQLEMVRMITRDGRKT